MAPPSKRTEDAIYFAIALRNGGPGLAVLHGWRVSTRDRVLRRNEVGRAANDVAPDADEFRRQQLDLYIPAGATGYWQGALRDSGEEIFQHIQTASYDDELLQVDLLYGDHEGGQRAIVRFTLSSWPGIEGKRVTALRYWNVDRADPR